MRKMKWSIFFLFALLLLTSCRGEKGVNESLDAVQTMDAEAVYSHLSADSLNKYKKEDNVD